MKNLFYVFFAVLSILSKAQSNLIPNPSFEIITTCPVSSANWNVCSSWNNVNMNLGAGLWGTPDYYHACGTGQTSPPNLFSGICTPQSGVGMMSIVVYNMGYPQYREYIAAPLNCAMQINSTYTLSFWLSNGTGYYSPWTIQNMAACFSVGPLTQSGYQPINVTPQCEILTNVVSPGWTQYTFTVTATASWNYITLGAFRSDAANNPTLSWPNPGGAASAYANYFIDNLSLLGPPSGSYAPVSISSNPSNGSICAGQSATLSATGSSTFVWSNNQTSASIAVSPLSNTIYTVTGSSNYSCGVASSNATILISVSPQPSISISGLQSICNGQSSTLTVSGAQNYLWNTNSTSSSIIVTPTLNSVYTVTGTTSNCSSTTSIGVTVGLNLTISIVGKSLVCRGTSITLTASGATSYTWNNGAVGNVLNVTPLNSTSYTVNGTVLGTSCQGNAVATVSVSECLGIEKSTTQDYLNFIKPNPFNNEVTIDLNCLPNVKVEIKLFNSLGNSIIETFNYFPKNESDCKILLNIPEYLPEGLYFFQVNQAGQSKIYKGIRVQNK